MSTKGRPVTKSVRLRTEESDLIAEISEREHLAEGTLLRKWVLDALAQARLEHAIDDYAAGELNLGEAASRAGVTLPRLLAELDARGVDTISPAHFHASIENLTALFSSSEHLRAGRKGGPDEDQPATKS